ncbi:MAG TPA: type II toxin-antitoxin system prevent-host-death family antitoxin [Candidatus Limnocylindria bacterium]
MAVVTIRELARSTGRVVDRVHRSGKAALVTRGGKPVVALVPIDEDALGDWVLAQSPAFVTSLRTAKADLARGRALTLDQFLARNPVPRDASVTKTAKKAVKNR